jgi:hypothetical protein
MATLTELEELCKKYEGEIRIDVIPSNETTTSERLFYITFDSGIGPMWLSERWLGSVDISRVENAIVEKLFYRMTGVEG